MQGVLSMFNSAEGIKVLGIISPCSAPKQREDEEMEELVDGGRARREDEEEGEEEEEEEAY